MAHVSLYRKYRPRTFAEIVGQDHVTRTLSRAVDEDRLHHAYLFTGPRGTGKTSTARILAMALNASGGPTSTPDPDDPIVASIRAGNAPDVIEIDAASNNKVEDVRDLVERVAFSPAIARVKIYIVDECHMLTTQAWNAFLKTIEEPPGHVLFVFATTEPHKVLPTVLSRTQRHDFRRVAASVLADHCRHIGELEGFTFADDALDAIVRAGDGSVRDTLSVLDQVVAFTGSDVTGQGVADVLGSVPASLLDSLAARLTSSDVAGVLTLVQQVADGGTDLRQFATDAVAHLRRLLLLKAAPEGGLVEATPDRVAELTRQADATGTADLLRAVELLNDAQPKMRAGNTRLPLEIALAKAALPESSGDPAAMAARLDRLEAMVADGAQLQRPAVAAATKAAPAAREQNAPVSQATTAPADVQDALPDEPTPSPVARAASTAEGDGPPQRDRAGGEHSGRQGVTTSAQAGAAPTPAPAPTGPTEPAASDRVTASSTPPRRGGGRTDDLAAIKAAWHAVLTTLGKSSKRLEAIIGQGEPVDIKDDILVVSFPFEFHAKQAEDSDTAKAVADVVEQITGTRYRLHPTVGDDSAPQIAEQQVADEAAEVLNSEAAVEAGEVVDDAALHDDAVKAVREGLGAEVIADTHASDS